MIKEDLFFREEKLHENILSSKRKKTDNQISGPVIHSCNIAISMDDIAPQVQIP